MFTSFVIFYLHTIVLTATTFLLTYTVLITHTSSTVKGTIAFFVSDNNMKTETTKSALTFVAHLI
jgi:hypothetical protein